MSPSPTRYERLTDALLELTARVTILEQEKILREHQLLEYEKKVDEKIRGLRGRIDGLADAMSVPLDELKTKDAALSVLEAQRIELQTKVREAEEKFAQERAARDSLSKQLALKHQEDKKIDIEAKKLTFEEKRVSLDEDKIDLDAAALKFNTGDARRALAVQVLIAVIGLLGTLIGLWVGANKSW